MRGCLQPRLWVPSAGEGTMASHQCRGHSECGRGEAEPPPPLPASPRAPGPGYTQEAALVLSTTRRVNKHPAFNCCHAQTCLTAPGLRCHLPLRAQHLLRAPAPHEEQQGWTLWKDPGCLRCHRACTGMRDMDVPMVVVRGGRGCTSSPRHWGAARPSPAAAPPGTGGRGSRSGCGRFGKRRGSPKVSCLRQGGDRPPGGKTPVRPAWLLRDLLPTPAVPGQDTATNPFAFPFPFHPGENGGVGGRRARVSTQPPPRLPAAPPEFPARRRRRGRSVPGAEPGTKPRWPERSGGGGWGAAGAARARTHHAGGAAVPHGSAPRSFPRRV